MTDEARAIWERNYERHILLWNDRAFRRQIRWHQTVWVMLWSALCGFALGWVIWGWR